MKMFVFQSLLLLAAVLAGCGAVEPILSKSYNISSIHFNKSEVFTSKSYTIYDIAFDLYKNDGSLLYVEHTYLRSTDGISTSTVASGFYSTLYGFKQFNSTHVFVLDTNYHCVKLVNREDKSTKAFAGSCGTPGFVDGSSAKFKTPWSIEINERDPQQLYITDSGNAALRSLDVESGKVSTVIRSGLSAPRGMAWYNGRLLVCNSHYISEVVWTKNGTEVTSSRLAGSTSGSYIDGDFSTARFYNPYDIKRLQDGLYLVADVSASRLRLLNMFEQRVSPVCFGTSAGCSTGSTLSAPYALAINKDQVYVASHTQIRKFSDYRCFMGNVTVYVYPDQQRAYVPLDSDNSAYWLPGEYHFSKKLGRDSCSFNVHVKVSPIVRTAVFRSEYDVTCDALDNPISKAFLHSILAHRKTELQEVCGGGCKMSTRREPWYTCKSNLLTITWPTMAVYPVDVKTTPTKYSSPIINRLKESDVYDAEIVLLAHNLPLVRAKANAKGETVQMILSSVCADKSKTYNERLDTCT